MTSEGRTSEGKEIGCRMDFLSSPFPFHKGINKTTPACHPRSSYIKSWCVGCWCFWWPWTHSDTPEMLELAKTSSTYYEKCKLCSSHPTSAGTIGWTNNEGMALLSMETQEPLFINNKRHHFFGLFLKLGKIATYTLENLSCPSGK